MFLPQYRKMSGNVHGNCIFYRTGKWTLVRKTGIFTKKKRKKKTIPGSVLSHCSQAKEVCNLEYTTYIYCCWEHTQKKYEIIAGFVCVNADCWYVHVSRSDSSSYGRGNEAAEDEADGHEQHPRSKQSEWHRVWKWRTQLQHRSESWTRTHTNTHTHLL